MSVVIVSWILILVAVFGLNYAHDVRGESQLIRLELERQQLKAWARSGIQVAQAYLLDADGEAIQSLGITGPENPLAFPFPCGSGWFAVGLQRSGGEFDQWVPGVADEAGKLPVALLDSTTLSLLPGLSDSAIDVLLDARDAAGSSRLPSFALLPDLDEISRESAHRYLSRYGDSVNINTASREVLVALGLPPHAVGKLLNWRAGKDRIPGTADDRRFKALDGTDQGIVASALNSEEAAVLALLRSEGKLAVASRFFRLTSRSWGEGFHGICEIHTIMLKPKDGSIKVLEWKVNWLN